LSADLYALHVAREEQPKYRRIADDLRAQIERGEYAPGDRLPTKAELMKRYDVALNTADNAIRLLRELGFAETRQGTGTYVCDPLPTPQPSPEAMMKRIDELAERLAVAEEWIARHDAARES
jgi:DNA-binding GntR family transcriptional regulator